MSQQVLESQKQAEKYHEKISFQFDNFFVNFQNLLGNPIFVDICESCRSFVFVVLQSYKNTEDESFGLRRVIIPEIVPIHSA